MILEGNGLKVIHKMQEQGKVKSFNLDKKNYIEKIKYVKDNWQSELKEKGVLVSMVRADYPKEIV